MGSDGSTVHVEDGCTSEIMVHENVMHIGSCSSELWPKIQNLVNGSLHYYSQYYAQYYAGLPSLNMHISIITIHMPLYGNTNV